jgi:glycosyltransferase involved in cell wall biosynthesis
VDLVLAQAEGPYLAEGLDSVRLVELNPRHMPALRTTASLPALVRYLRREHPAVLLSALNGNFFALWARRLAGIPRRVVISEHNNFSRSTQALPTLHRWLTPRLVRRFYPWADGIIAVSTGVAHDLACVVKLPDSRIQVIYNPIVTPDLRAKAQAPLEHPWYQAGEPPVIVAIGRLTQQKDFPTLLKAFAQVRRTRLARLVILGEGEERSALESLVQQLGLAQDVSLPGFVANPYPYLVHASLFVLSSRWEGLPTVLVEALYCGVPVIATDCPSGPREILSGGKYGLLVPVEDAAAMASAIESQLVAGVSPPPDSWRPYDLDTVVDQYVAVLLDGGPCAP